MSTHGPVVKRIHGSTRESHQRLFIFAARNPSRGRTRRAERAFEAAGARLNFPPLPAYRPGAAADQLLSSGSGAAERHGAQEERQGEAASAQSCSSHFLADRLPPLTSSLAVAALCRLTPPPAAAQRTHACRAATDAAAALSPRSLALRFSPRASSLPRSPPRTSRRMPRPARWMPPPSRSSTRRSPSWSGRRTRRRSTGTTCS